MNSSQFSEIFKLSVAERIQLVEDVWDSLAGQGEELVLTEAQRAELDSRLEADRQSPGGTSWEEAKARLTREK